MPARSRIDRPVPLTTHLPESVSAQLTLHLFSPLEGRVPKGAYQAFFVERIREFFSWRRLDLHPFGFGRGFFVSGPPEMIDELEKRLTKCADL